MKLAWKAVCPTPEGHTELFAVTSDEQVAQDSSPERSLIRKAFGAAMLAPDDSFAAFCQRKPEIAQRLLAAAAFRECVKDLTPEGFDHWCVPKEVEGFRPADCTAHWDIADSEGRPLVRVWVRLPKKR